MESYPAISEEFEIQFENETKHKREKAGILLQIEHHYMQCIPNHITRWYNKEQDYFRYNIISQIISQEKVHVSDTSVIQHACFFFVCLFLKWAYFGNPKLGPNLGYLRARNSEIPDRGGQGQRANQAALQRG